MNKVKASNGYLAYTCTAQDTERLGGLGICDECGAFAETGYLVPVLNHYMCPVCFQDWQGRGRYYPEDIPIQDRNAAYYESLLPLEGGST